MKTILLATDGSPSAQEALELAVDLCQDTGARLEVLTVRTNRPHGDPQAPLGDQMDRELAVEQIAREGASMAAAEGVTATPHTAFGDPATMIAEEAKALGADLIVVGCHGRSGIRGAVLGSVSRKLLTRSPVPVTVVRSAQTPSAVAG